MSDSAFMRLNERLSEVQMELMLRAWTESPFERCDKAYELRQRLWDAIADYRDEWIAAVKGA